MPGLATLDLESNNLRDDSMVQLCAALREAVTLKKLILRGNSFGEV